MRSMYGYKVGKTAGLYPAFLLYAGTFVQRRDVCTQIGVQFVDFWAIFGYVSA